MYLSIMEVKRTACGGEKIDEKLSVDFGGSKIYFCEKSCIDEFMKDPEKFIASDHMRIELPTEREVRGKEKKEKKKEKEQDKSKRKKEKKE
jgi:YHS domain-containing protein